MKKKNLPKNKKPQISSELLFRTDRNCKFYKGFENLNFIVMNRFIIRSHFGFIIYFFGFTHTGDQTVKN